MLILYQRPKGTGKTVGTKEKGGALLSNHGSQEGEMQLDTSLTKKEKGGRAHLPSYFHHIPFTPLAARHTKCWLGPWSVSHSAFGAHVPTLVRSASPRALQDSWRSTQYCKASCPKKPGLGTSSSSLLSTQQLAGQPDLPRWYSEHMSALVWSNRVTQQRLCD